MFGGSLPEKPDFRLTCRSHSWVLYVNFSRSNMFHRQMVYRDIAPRVPEPDELFKSRLRRSRGLNVLFDFIICIENKYWICCVGVASLCCSDPVPGINGGPGEGELVLRMKLWNAYSGAVHSTQTILTSQLPTMFHLEFMLCKWLDFSCANLHLKKKFSDSPGIFPRS